MNRETDYNTRETQLRMAPAQLAIVHLVEDWVLSPKRRIPSDEIGLRQSWCPTCYQARNPTQEPPMRSQQDPSQ